MSISFVPFSALVISFKFADVEASWKTDKSQHLERTAPLTNSLESIDYFGNGLKNDRHFNDVLHNILIPRPVTKPEHPGHRSVREYIATTMSDLGWSTELDRFSEQTPLGEKPFVNVMATLDPLAPRRMVIACHYDSLLKPEGFLGATDSAVPCAQMINLAYTLRKELSDQKEFQNSELTLQLVFFDGEEALRRWRGNDNTYGSRHLAAKWDQESYNRNGISGNQNDRIDIFMLLDLIGVANQQFVSMKQKTDGWFKRLSRIEESLSRLNSFQSYNPNRPMFTEQTSFFRAGEGIQDDHMHFDKKGVPILHIIPPNFPDVWHKSGDNKRALHPASIKNLNKILRVFVAEYLGLSASA